MSNINTSNWKEFKLGELFDITISKSIDKNKLIFESNGEYDFVGRSSVNYGVQGKLNRLDYAPNPANTFSVAQIGETVCLFREKEWYASQNMFVLQPKDEACLQAQLYITTVVNKALSIYASAYTYPTLQELKDTVILLPAITEDVPDWAYMEEYIEALSTRVQRHIAGLNTVASTEKDNGVLSSVRTFKIFELPEVFNIINTHSISQSQIVENSGEIPYLTATSENNAVQTKIDCSSEWTDKGNCIFIGGKTMVITYQEHDFCSNDSHNLALYLKDIKYRTRGVQLYIISALRRSLAAKYTWGDSISKKKIQNDIVALPLKPNTTDEIDYDYMEQYMAALQQRVKQTLDTLEPVAKM